MIAFLLCALLGIFAIGAKVAMYHQREPGARPIAAAKAWVGKRVLAESGTTTVPVTPQAAVAVILLLSLCVVSIPLPHGCERSDLPSKIDDFTPFSVRPPPAI